jgi:HD-GYP domain-containing protein (c-di-GMP phosphodiesterase class II)
MKKISVALLKPGLIFSKPVFIEGDNLFIPEGIAVKQKEIGRLRSWGIETVETDGDIVTAASGGVVPSPPQKAVKIISRAVKEAAPGILSLKEVVANSGAYKVYKDLIQELGRLLSAVASGERGDGKTIDSMAVSLVDNLREQRSQFIGYILGGELSGNELAKSSVNAAILSALTAQVVKLPNHRVIELVTAALLHDVGMLRLPPAILEKKGNLSPEELNLMHGHTAVSYKVIVKELGLPAEVGIIAYQHHERWDGEGYPRRTQGEHIPAGARILSIADAFEAMVSEKPYRNSMIGYEAMKNLMAENAKRFDPAALKAFIRIMGIYPIGSIILLNNKSIARVVEVKGEAPLRPKVRVLIDELGTVYDQDEGNIIDLLAEKSLFIARAVDPRELSA